MLTLLSTDKNKVDGTAYRLQWSKKNVKECMRCASRRWVELGRGKKKAL